MYADIFRDVFPKLMCRYIYCYKLRILKSSSYHCAYKVKRLWGRIWFERVC